MQVIAVCLDMSAYLWGDECDTLACLPYQLFEDFHSQISTTFNFVNVQST